MPKAVRIAVLVNPSNASVAETTLQEVQQAAPAIGLQIQMILNAATTARSSGEWNDDDFDVLADGDCHEAAPGRLAPDRRRRR
jgi:hypothetical protein